jgi:hypothetical protein
MMSRERKIRPAMTSGWLLKDIANNLENFAGLSRIGKTAERTGFPELKPF